MIIGVLGKGGSGKSTVATALVAYLRTKKTPLLAIDADHNMDLSHNLTADTNNSPKAYLGSGLTDLYNYLDIPHAQKYDKAFIDGISKTFSIQPLDSYSEKYTMALDETTRLMVAGPQTEAVLHGKTCSHILTTPLKLYLPLLILKSDEYVIVDEKAGADGVTTGIVTGLDVGVIVVEPALHSIKTAHQIADLMDFYHTPYIFVANKVNTNEDRTYLQNELSQTPLVYLTQNSNVQKGLCNFKKTWSGEMNTLLNIAATLQKNDRIKRTTLKFLRNESFSSIQ